MGLCFGGLGCQKRNEGQGLIIDYELEGIESKSSFNIWEHMFRYFNRKSKKQCDVEVTMVNLKP